MSVVEVYTPEGKRLGRIDDVNQTVEVTEEWEEIAGPPRKKRKPAKPRKDTDE